MSNQRSHLVSCFFAAALAAGCSGGGGPACGPELVCGTESGTGCASVCDHVDLYTPVFTNPTRVTHPLYPISDLDSVVFFGEVDGAPFRTETTLLPQTRVIEWNGQPVETLVSQYMAFSDGRIEEIAIDWYAQDDDGSVWYFGEDVADYDETGEIYTHEGTWLVGRDGAPLPMIMFAHPAPGDVWLAENIAPIAWEEITVQSVDQVFDGPSGPVPGGMVGSELHMDGTRQEKLFAPGYGEFSTGSIETQDLEALALAVPIDALDAPRPAELGTLATRTADVFDAADAGAWPDADAAMADVEAAWTALGSGPQPPLVAAEMARVLGDLADAVTARSAEDARQEAITAARVVFDLWLRHIPPSDVDRVRFDLWFAQVAVDAAAGEVGSVKGDAATATLVWDRIAHTFDPTARADLEARLGQLRDRAMAGDTAGAAAVAADTRAVLSTIGWRRP